MEKLTISRVGQTKDIQTKFGLKPKTGVQFKEYGDIWHDIWTSGLKEGQVLEGTRASRDYQGKTYWDFKLPKKDEVMAGAVKEQGDKLEQILNKLTGMNLILQSIREHTVPSRDKQVKVNTEVDYPASEYPEGEIPF